MEAALASFKERSGAHVRFRLLHGARHHYRLGRKNDIIVLDKLHSPRGCRQTAGAKLRVFAHNDLDALEGILKWANQRKAEDSAAPRPQILLVTESVFSMDGDHAPLRELVELKEKYGAWLMLDEAHATGLYGANGRGLADESRVSDRIEIQMGTLGKAFGARGGYIAVRAR